MDCSKTMNFLKANAQLCDGTYCSKCPLFQTNNSKNKPCDDLLFQFPETYLEIIQKWSDEHPPKTRAMDFLEKFPNAETKDGIPVVCVKSCGYKVSGKCFNTYDCPDCWNSPLE